MSLWRTLRNNCGRLFRSNQIDFWQISLTVQDPPIPNMPLETPSGMAARNSTLSAIEAQDSPSFSASAVISASLSTSEVKDTASLNTSALVSVNLSASETQDIGSFLTENLLIALLSATENPDIATLLSQVLINADLNITEEKDSIIFSVSVLLSAILDVSENEDIISLDAEAILSAELNVTDEQDIVSFEMSAEISAERNCELIATENLDSVTFDVKHEVPQVYPPAYGGIYIPRKIEIKPKPINIIFTVSENQDRAIFDVSLGVLPVQAIVSIGEQPDRISVATIQDYTDEEIVMMLMMSADEDGVITVS